MPKITLPAPPSIDPATTAEGFSLLGRHHSDGSPVIIVYCRRNHAGGIFYVNLTTWKLIARVASAGELLDLLQSSVTLPEAQVVREWRDRVDPPQALNG